MNPTYPAGSPASPQSRPLPPARIRVRPQPMPQIDPPGDAAPEPDDPSRSYDVGYGKPPRHTQFKPGQSGNPKGRPRGAKGLRTMVRETMTQKVPVRTANGVAKMTRIEAMLHKTHELAMKGNARALAELLKLYAAAVPEAACETGTGNPETLTATDLEILDMLRCAPAPSGSDEADDSDHRGLEASLPEAAAAINAADEQGAPPGDGSPAIATAQDWVSDWDRKAV